MAGVLALGQTIPRDQIAPPGFPSHSMELVDGAKQQAGLRPGRYSCFSATDGWRLPARKAPVLPGTCCFAERLSLPMEVLPASVRLCPSGAKASKGRAGCAEYPFCTPLVEHKYLQTTDNVYSSRFPPLSLPPSNLITFDNRNTLT